MTKKIVAIAGGSIGRTYPYETEIFDKEIVSLTNKSDPKLLFIGTASNDDIGYFEIVDKVFSKIGCSCKRLAISNAYSKEELEEIILNQDIIYVGGGNTKMMMRIWRDSGVDQYLKQAYEKGTIMCGVSAGAICWFEMGSSDSLRIEENNPDAPLIKVTGLGFCKALFAPHCDSVKGHPENVKRILENENLVGLSLSNCCAVEIIDDTYRLIVADASNYDIEPYGIKSYWRDGEYIKESIIIDTKFKDLRQLLLKGGK